MESKPIVLRVEGVRKKFGKFTALDNLSFQLRKGTHLLMLGPNGAGKTTLIKCIMGMSRYDGEIFVGDINVRKNANRAKRLIGYVPQHYAFYENLNVQQHAELSSRLKEMKEDQFEEKLKMVDLWEVRKKRVRALSDGMRQRLGIALALIGDPPLLILDEPTSNVDMRGQLEFQGLLRALLGQGKSLLTTTHLTGLGELADEVLIIDRGKLVTLGPPEKLLGRMSSKGTIYIRPNGADTSSVLELVRKYEPEVMGIRGEWVRLSVPNDVKLEVVNSLLGSSFKIKDLIIERSTIESQYLNLLGVQSDQ